MSRIANGAGVSLDPNTRYGQWAAAALRNDPNEPVTGPVGLARFSQYLIDTGTPIAPAARSEAAAKHGFPMATIPKPEVSGDLEQQIALLRQETDEHFAQINAKLDAALARGR